MPTRGSQGHEAVALMVSRLTLCSEMREAFTGEKFDSAFDLYFARSAISKEHRSQLKKMMADRDCVEAMKTVNTALHDLNLKLNCKMRPRQPFDRKPDWFRGSLACALLVLGTLGWLWFSFGFHPAMAIGIVTGLVLLWDSLTYEWL